MALCHRVAAKFWRSHQHEVHDWRELVGAAYEGLVESVRRWDPKRTGKFERYAFGIMWRRIIDYLRVCGRYTRNQKRHGVWFHSYDVEAPGGDLTYLKIIAGTTPSAAECAEDNDAAEQFWDAVRRVLPPRSFTVFVLYYRHGLTMREVGVCLGVTESRVCQIHRRALPKLQLLLEAV